MEYLTAKEANAFALEARSVYGSYLREETDSVMEKIANLANTGETLLNIKYILDTVVQTRLKHLGYSVEVTVYRNEDWTKISW